MILHKVLVNYEVTGHILVAADTRDQAETKAKKSLKATGWTNRFVLSPEWVEGTETVLDGEAEPIGEVVT